MAETNETLLSELEKRTFESFSELSLWLRENHEPPLRRATLARRFGYSKGFGASIQQVEEELINPSPKMLDSFAKYFGIDDDFLIGVYTKTIVGRMKKKLQDYRAGRRKY